MDALVVIAASTVLLSVGVWWFTFTAPMDVDTQATVVQKVRIDVSGGYHPGRVSLEAGRPARLVFNRWEADSCSQRVVFEKLGITADLPIGKPVAVEFTPKKRGIYEFTCQRRVLRGEVVVR